MGMPWQTPPPPPRSPATTPTCMHARPAHKTLSAHSHLYPTQAVTSTTWPPARCTRTPHNTPYHHPHTHLLTQNSNLKPPLPSSLSPPGRLHFVKFESSRVEDVIRFIEAKGLHRHRGRSGAKFMRVKATGGEEGGEGAVYGGRGGGVAVGGWES